MKNKQRNILPNLEYTVAPCLSEQATYVAGVGVATSIIYVVVAVADLPP